MIAVIEAANVAELNRIIDNIGGLDGVESTMSSILLDISIALQNLLHLRDLGRLRLYDFAT